jgi:hypothetical protein
MFSKTSGRWGDLAFVAGRARPAGAAARTLFSLLFRSRSRSNPNRGRKRVERERLDIGRLAPVALSAIAAGRTVLAIFVAGIAARTFALRTLAPFAAFGARLAFLAFLPVLAILAFGALLDFLFGALAFAVELILVASFVLEILAALRTLILETGTTFAQNAEVMVRELQIIFGLDPVTGQLRVARQALVFLEQLRGIAPLAVILTVAVRPSAYILRPLSPATAPAAALTIIDQSPLPSKQKTLSPWP